MFTYYVRTLIVNLTISFLSVDDNLVEYAEMKL